jgi:hypothetical protein
VTAPSFHTPESASAFWASLDSQSRLMLAKTAPRVAGRWTEETQGFYRYNDSIVVAGVMLDDDVCYWYVTGIASKLEDSVNEARVACDEKLREMGFVLEDE